MEGTAQLIWGMLFGAIGLGFFVYGKKQKAVVPLISGISLFIFPYFVSNLYLLVLVGGAIIALPYFVRI
jgi:predicted membrane protein